MPLARGYAVLRGTLKKLERDGARLVLTLAAPRKTFVVPLGGDGLLVSVLDGFDHPLLDGLEDTAPKEGLHKLVATPPGEESPVALDYLRANLVDPATMEAISLKGGPLSRLERALKAAVGDREAQVYAFGEPGPEGVSLEAVQMNQGGQEDTCGVWQDGGLLVYLPEEDRWVAAFFAAPDRVWHTDASGKAIEGLGSAAEGSVRILGALVNPEGAQERGQEEVYLFNPAGVDLSVSGWVLMDGEGRREVLDGTVAARRSATARLEGKARLVNDGGTLTLLDPTGRKGHGVSWTRTQAATEGEIVWF